MADELEDDEFVTQYVFKGEEGRNVPRPGIDNDGLSVLRGIHTTHQAAVYVRVGIRCPIIGDGVRHASVEGLRRGGFRVTLSPSRRIPIHVSVAFAAQWTHETCEQFDACFGAVEHWRDGDEDERRSPD